ncbi:Oidioi.mRNA.OKI2018_I69.chr2.g4804.t1.cds [Oikopleura dioica]|uniref:Oidioi.mRNA.OKI2018_I69.chr2.g4804.t1.cds n=1 Tax=Oikopleura dioica TaxID=34765 RepID=A0ABN7SY72_OIKDI|nr:Oidioi.mRNA.OKI2018_I69.chr2.g4804.t1.cds [Oikopleura dioica]
MINQQLLPMSGNIPKHLQAVRTAVKLFDDFCHKRWDELKAEATKEGMVLTSFLELVTDSRGDPVCIERINHEWRKTNLKKVSWKSGQYDFLLPAKHIQKYGRLLF